MPSERERENAGLKLLLREKKLTEDEWIEMIKARAEMMKPYFDMFTLQELGNANSSAYSNYVYTAGGKFREIRTIYPIKDDQPIVIVEGNKKFSLKTQGIFFTRPFLMGDYADSGLIKYSGGEFWSSGCKIVGGLARSGEWILVRVYFEWQESPRDNYYAKVRGVIINEGSLEQVVNLSLSPAGEHLPQEIWKALGEAAKQWETRQADLHCKATYLAGVIKQEESALALIEES